jgi:hypothetical protein
VWTAAEDIPLNGWGQFGIAAPALTALMWVLWQWIRRERTSCEETVKSTREAHLATIATIKAEHREQIDDLKDLFEKQMEYERALRHEVQARLDALQSSYDLLQEKIREKYVDGLRDAYHGVTEAHQLVEILRDELRKRPP